MSVILKKLLTPDEVGEILGVTSSTLAVWRATKRYPLKYIKSGRLIRYRPEDLEDFINSRVQEGQYEHY